MKRIATIVEGGRTVGLVHGPEFVDQTIRVGRRTWRFDFDTQFGPLWLRADGLERKNQNPGNPAVWRALERWQKRNVKP